MKFYIQAFINSFYNIDWLRQQKHNGKRAANYFVLFILLSSAVFAGVLTYKIQTSGHQFVAEFRDEIPVAEIELKEGKLNVAGIEQPYQKIVTDDDGDKIMIYVDTKSTSTPQISDLVDNTRSTGASILVMRESITMYDHTTNQADTQYFQDFGEEFTFTTDEAFDNIINVLNQWHIIFFVLWGIMFIVIGIGKLIHLLIISTIVYIITNIRKINDWNFKQIYVLSLFAITAPMIVDAVLMFTSIRTPFLSTVLTTLLVTLVVLKQSDTPTTEMKSVEEAKPEEKQK